MNSQIKLAMGIVGAESDKLINKAEPLAVAGL